MSGAENNLLAPANNGAIHRPLKHVKSASGRLECAEGNNCNKNKSTSALLQPAAVSELKEATHLLRKRSRSAPLTLEATKIAQELTRMSDLLNIQYTVKHRAVNRVRRHTVGSPKEHEQDRRSFHFDYKNYEHLQNGMNAISEELPDFQRGTSV